MQEKFEKLKEFYKNMLGRESGIDAAFDLLENVMSSQGEHSELILDIEGFFPTGLPKEAHMAAFAAAAPDSADFEDLCDTYNLTTSLWFKFTDPKPTLKRLNAQFGVHLEEVREMFPECHSDIPALNDKMALADALLKEIAEEFKSGRANLVIHNNEKFFDSLLDQKVTLTGVAHLAGYSNFAEAVARVDWANFTKFVDGVPQYKEGGKVAKGPYFQEPNLKGMTSD